MSNSTNNPVNNPINDPMNHPPAHRRIILALPSLLLGLGLCACGNNNSAPARSDAALDQSAPPTPDAGASPRDIGTPGLDSGLLSGDGAPGASETGVATLDDAPGSSDTATAPLDGTLGSSDAGAPTLDGEAAPPAVRGMVAVNSDYQSTAVSLLDPDGNVVKDGCINSGTGKPGLTMTLSGDVVLPSQLLTTSPITLIDRGNNVLIWIDPTTCAPLRELDVSTGFTADPHDYVELAPNKAYVTRYEQNTAAKATDTNFDQGNDLLIVDPSQPEIPRPHRPWRLRARRGAAARRSCALGQRPGLRHPRRQQYRLPGQRHRAAGHSRSRLRSGSGHGGPTRHQELQRTPQGAAA